MDEAKFYKQVEVSFETKNAFFDPRPDLGDENESILWCELFSYAHGINKNLFYALHGFRCQGTRLVPGSSGGWVMRPEIGGDSWASQEEYDEWKKKYLEPVRRDVVCALKKLR